MSARFELPRVVPWQPAATAELRDARDELQCARILRQGSRSFRAAALLLPPRVRRPATVIYAFCRICDDAVDDASDPTAALALLRARLDAIMIGRPQARAVDRALCRVVRSEALPRAPFDMLLEGFAWDAGGRRYETLADLVAYCVRVASSVGVLMSCLMGRREPRVLRHACALGVAMQLTNIARDVGEDARAGRLYLPGAWLREAGVEVDALLRAPRPSPPLRRVVARLLREADRYYAIADRGIPCLPSDCRVAIRAARLIYRDIGREIARRDYDSITERARTSGARKAQLLALACLPGAGERAGGEPQLEPAAEGHLSTFGDATSGMIVSPSTGQ